MRLDHGEWLAEGGGRSFKVKKIEGRDWRKREQCDFGFESFG